MHKITMYENLRQMMEDELARIEKKDLTKESLCNIYYLTRSISSICKILSCEEKEYYDEFENGNGVSEGYGNRVYGRTSHRRRSSYDQYDYRPDYPTRHYSMMHEPQNESHFMPRYSYDEGHTTKEKLSMMLAGAETDEERKALQECLNKLR